MGMPSFQDATDPRLEGPRDPALERLLPPAHREDEAVAAEFRRLTEQGLRERKTANLTTAVDALRDADGDKVVLSAAQAQALVVALTDVRLLLGERLGLRTDDDAEELAQRLDDADAGRPGDAAGRLLRLHDLAAGVADPGPDVLSRPRARRTGVTDGTPRRGR